MRVNYLISLCLSFPDPFVTLIPGEICGYVSKYSNLPIRQHVFPLEWPGHVSTALLWTATCSLSQNACPARSLLKAGISVQRKQIPIQLMGHNQWAFVPQIRSWSLGTVWWYTGCHSTVKFESTHQVWLYARWWTFKNRARQVDLKQKSLHLSLSSILFLQGL